MVVGAPNSGEVTVTTSNERQGYWFAPVVDALDDADGVVTVALAVAIFIVLGWW